MSAIILLRRTALGVAAASTLWTGAQKGDAAGSFVENSPTSLTMVGNGTSEVDNHDLAYQIAASGDMQIVAEIPALFNGYTENFTGFGVGITEGLADGEWFAQCWIPNVNRVRFKFGTAISNTTELGLAGEVRPRFVGLTYHSLANEIRAWESADGVSWLQVGTVQTRVLTYPAFGYIFATSAETGQNTTAIITGCVFSDTITLGASTLVDNTALDTYGTGLDRTLDSGWRIGVDDITTGWDLSMPATVVPAANSGIFTFQNYTQPGYFQGNSLRLVNARWVDLEPTENNYDLTPITDFLTNPGGSFDGIMLNVRGMVTEVIDGTGADILFSEWTAPQWLIDLVDPGGTGANQWQEAIRNNAQITNLRIDNATVQSAFLDLITEIANAGIPAHANLIAQIIHAVSDTRGEEWGGGQANQSWADAEITNIINQWATEYGVNADKLAWLKDRETGGLEPPTIAATNAGCGGRGGAIENWLQNGYTPGSATINDPDNPSGQVLDVDGYLSIDPNFDIIAENRHWADQNEVYNSRSSLPEEAKPRAYKGGNLRAVQMGRNVLATSNVEALDSRLDNWVALQLGQDAASSEEAWCWLMRTWTRFSGANREINNFSRFMTQKEINGATTLTNNRLHEKNLSLNAGLPESLWNIDWSRRGASIGFALDPAFLTGGPHNVALKFVYLDAGVSSFNLNYSAGTRSLTKENSGDVRTVTWQLSDFRADATGDDPDFFLTGDATTDFLFARVCVL